MRTVFSACGFTSITQVMGTIESKSSAMPQ
jgi:hypothetical protein